MKRILAFVLIAVLVLGLAACGAVQEPAILQQDVAEVPATPEPTATPEPVPETRIFTDSLGREVEIPVELNKVAVSGPLAQIVLFALCPDKLAGFANDWSKDAEQYIDAKYFELPILGQLYGGKGELNLETLLASGAEVIIDVGEPKGSSKEDLDDLQEQTGIPFVHITATTQTMGDAYRKLGELVNMEAEAEALAAYCDNIYAQTVALTESVEKVNVLYLLGDQGLNVIAQGSYHAEIIDLLCNNLAVVDEPSSKGTGNEVDMEQILLWNPDVILFAPESIYATAAEDATWQQLTAIRNGKYYEVPFGPYNWMGFPPSVQRYLGMLWLGKLLYPDAVDYDLQQAIQEYYQMFYHCELTQEQYEALVANSIGK